MIKRTFAIVILFAALVLTSAPSFAQIPDRYDKDEIIQEDDFIHILRGTFTAKGAPGSLNEDAYVLIGFEGELRLGLLALDPVVSFKMRFEPLGGRVTIPNFDPGAQEYNTIGLGEVPAAALEKIDLNNVRVAFSFLEQTNEVVIVEDSGVFVGQGEWSFNVPDGYSWRNVFYEGGFGKLDFTDWPHVPEERARSIWNSMTLDAFQVINADLLLSDLHNWYREYDTTAEYFATLRAIDRVSEGISISYGYDAKKAVRADLAEAVATAGNGLRMLRAERGFDREEVWRFGDQPDYMADFSEATEALKQILNRLINLPSELREGNNHAPFEQTVADVETILNAPQQLKRDFSVLGPEPDNLPRGYEATFDDPEPRVFELGGAPCKPRSNFDKCSTVADYDTREVLYQIDHNFPGYGLLGGRYLVDIRPWRWEDDDCDYLDFDLIDPEPKSYPAVVTTLRIACNGYTYDRAVSIFNDDEIKIFMRRGFWNGYEMWCDVFDEAGIADRGSDTTDEYDVYSVSIDELTSAPDVLVLNEFVTARMLEQEFDRYDPSFNGERWDCRKGAHPPAISSGDIYSGHFFGLN